MATPGVEKFAGKKYNRGVTPNWVKYAGETRTIGDTAVTVYVVDKDDFVLFCSGTTVPTGAGYAKSCSFIDTDVATGIPALYENIGTTAAASFNLIGAISAGEITLAEGNILVGNASGVAAALNAKTTTQILVGNGTTITSVPMSSEATMANTGAVTLANAAVIGKVLTGYVSGAGVVAAGDTILQAVNKLNGNTAVLSAAGVGGSLTNTHIIVGSGAGVAADVAMSGDATIANTGAVTIAASAVTGAKTADAAGVASATGFVKKYALVVYDFAINGGAQGEITLPTASIPDNAVVNVDSYDVLTTFTSGGVDAATVKVGLATDGDLTTAVAISDGSNPWDEGTFTRIAGGLATPLSKKTTAARAVVLTVGGGQDLTAGKAVFNLSYWISQ